MDEIRQGVTLVGLIFLIFSLFVAEAWFRGGGARAGEVAKWMFVAIWGLIGFGVDSWVIGVVFWGTLSLGARLVGLLFR
jgi:hypothetical protein